MSKGRLKEENLRILSVTAVRNRAAGLWSAGGKQQTGFHSHTITGGGVRGIILMNTCTWASKCDLKLFNCAVLYLNQ